MKTAMKAEAMRLSNTSLVLSTILGSPTPVSRAAVAASTHLTRATVSRLVDSLLAANVIEELEPTHVSPGRPALPLRPTPHAHATVAVAVLPMSITACVMDLAGTVLDVKRVEIQGLEGPCDDATPEVIFAQVNDLVRALTIPEGTTVIGCAVTLPGIISDHVALAVPNMGWTDVNIDDYLDLPFDVPVQLFNEADAAGYSKLYEVPGRPSEITSFMYIAANTGIGSGIFINGQLYRGAHGWAGEIGHLLVKANGPACRCGSNGCLERYIGYAPLLAHAGLPETTTPEEILTAWECGEDQVVEAMQTAGRKLGRGIAGIANLMDIENIYLGGHLGILYPAIKETMEEEIQLRTLTIRCSQLRVMPANDTRDAATVGACLATFAAVIANPERLLATGA